MPSSTTPAPWICDRPAPCPPASFNRLLSINVEGPYNVVHAALDALRGSDNPHILNISPPLNLHPSWFTAHVGHTVGKYAESMLTLGWAAEVR